jgi:hypothetical protein
VLELLELRRRVEQIDVVLEHLQELPKQIHMRISEQTSKQTLEGTESRRKGGEGTTIGSPYHLGRAAVLGPAVERRSASSGWRRRGERARVGRGAREAGPWWLYMQVG